MLTSIRAALVITLAVLPGVGLGDVCGPEQITLTYPQEARNEYITGLLTATFKVNRHGRANGIRLQGVRAFAADVRNVLKRSYFDPNCRGRNIHMEFSFGLDRNLPLDTPMSVRRVSATEYHIVAPTDLTGSIDVDPFFIDESDRRLSARLSRWVRFWKR